MERRHVALLGLFLAVAVLVLVAQANIHAGTAPQAEPSASLMQVDAEFDRAVAEKGLEAWVSYFADDGMMLRGGEVVQGPDAIRDLMAPAFAMPGFSLRWQPERADIALSGDLGYTQGVYQNTITGSDGSSIVTTGRYITIWKKQPDGSWKAAVDIGSASPPPEAPSKN